MSRIVVMPIDAFLDDLAARIENWRLDGPPGVNPDEEADRCRCTAELERQAQVIRSTINRTRENSLAKYVHAVIQALRHLEEGSPEEAARVLQECRGKSGES